MLKDCVYCTSWEKSGQLDCILHLVAFKNCATFGNISAPVPAATYANLVTRVGAINPCAACDTKTPREIGKKIFKWWRCASARPRKNYNRIQTWKPSQFFLNYLLVPINLRDIIFLLNVLPLILSVADESMLFYSWSYKNCIFKSKYTCFKWWNLSSC